MKFVLLAALLVGASTASDPVKVDLYFEGLCPGCHQMIRTQIYPVYQKLKDIMDVNFFAYGNASKRRNPNGSYTFTCQHGVAECTTNMMISCLQGHTNSTAEIVEFVNCVVSQYYPQNAGPTCAPKTSVSWTTINTCMNAWEGEELELKAATATENLNPPHQWVPWTVLDGAYCDSCTSNLLNLVCAAYTGPNRPAACGNKCYRN